MYTKILIRFGELSLKGKNKMTFVRKLAKNIQTLTQIEPEVSFDRIFIPYSEGNLAKLQYVFGIYSYSPVVEVSSELEAIKEIAKQLMANQVGQTFKVAARRADKNFALSSQDLNFQIGGFLKNQFPNLEVKVKNPDIKMEIEVRSKHTFIFVKRIKALGGLPTGVNGKVLHLLSGGIDSPVAAFEMMKRGIHVDFLNFITPPHTDEKTIAKINQLTAVLLRYQGKATLYQSNYTELMNVIGLVSKQSYKINLMRRSFYRIANMLALKNDYLGISNGDNLGQVASQTLESLATINSQTTLAIYRPLLTRDKIETIEQAKKIKTYEIAIIKANESCEIFAPREPVTKPTEHIALALENELAVLPKLEKANLKTIKKQKITLDS